jgi:broad specificity phosphatase PhoE
MNGLIWFGRSPTVRRFVLKGEHGLLERIPGIDQELIHYSSDPRDVRELRQDSPSARRRVTHAVAAPVGRSEATGPAAPGGKEHLVLYLVRHGHAGDKRAWRGDDRDRPLSERGRREAAGLVALLRGYPVGAIASSPAVRCTQTVQPLAVARRLPVQLDPLLEVDSDTERVLARLVEGAHEEVVWCTHGELIGALLDRLRRDGAPISPGAAWPKGSVWLLELAGSAVRAASYLAPRR